MYRNLMHLVEEAGIALKAYQGRKEFADRKGLSTWVIYAIGSAIGGFLVIMVLVVVLRRLWGS